MPRVGSHQGLARSTGARDILGMDLAKREFRIRREPSALTVGEFALAQYLRGRLQALAVTSGPLGADLDLVEHSILEIDSLAPVLG